MAATTQVRILVTAEVVIVAVMAQLRDLFYACLVKRKLYTRLALVGYIKLFLICIYFINLDISLLSFILIVNVWLV